MLPRARSAVAFVLALAAAGCEDGHQFISPKTEQGIPGFEGPPPPTASPEVPDFIESGPIEAKPLTFFKTQDSSEWVARAFKVQARYARVIAVEPDGKPQAKVSVPRLDLNAAPGAAAASAEELPVTLTVRTLQEAAKEARGGDLVAVLPGHYQGFTLGDKADAGDEKYLRFEALGAPGDVVIDKATGGDRRWMVLLQGAHHVILRGFNLAGSETPGAVGAKGPYAGILINGDFVRTSRLAHHIAVLGNFSHHHAKWGIHSVDSHTVLTVDCVCRSSCPDGP